jgi:blocked early in transport 1
MSEAYERERQNNSRLDELSAKVSALRGVTIDIYDNARAQDVIVNTVRLSSPSARPLKPLVDPYHNLALSTSKC